MKDMSGTGIAVGLATRYHKGDGERIVHLFQVAGRLKERDEVVVALLHDVLEDTECTYEEIQHWFGFEIAKAVQDVTKRKSETWEEHVERIAKASPLVKRVKCADLLASLDGKRSGDPLADPGTLESRYTRALATLGHTPEVPRGD